MTPVLRYHQAVFDLLHREPRFSDERQQALRAIEERMGRPLPAAVAEWFALEGCDDLFADNTSPDWLAPLDELGDPGLASLGYLAVAAENQGVVEWRARLTGDDDPPVYDNNDSPDPAAWRLCAATFSGFIRHMIANGLAEQAGPGLRLASPADHAPDAALIERLLRSYTEWPRSASETRIRHCWFNEHGRIIANAAPAGDGGPWTARWALEAATAEGLLTVAGDVWDCGTLAATLAPNSADPQARAEEEEALGLLRGR